jgi:dGTPase
METRSQEAKYFQDRDRLVGSAAFRRLAGKTQVVACPSDPRVRTRLTHTLEVSSIAREMGRALGLVEPLVDAIALGHDLGHPAFGHAGEKALAALVPGGFHHAAQGVRVVTQIELGLDLSPAVVEGILKHSKGRSGAIFARGAAHAMLTREARVARAADLFAYACHDLDDAYSLDALRPLDLPRRVVSVLGQTPIEVRNNLVLGTVRASLREGELALEAESESALQELRAFLYERLYEGPRIAQQTSFVRSLVEALWETACSDEARFFRAAAQTLGSAGPVSFDMGRRFIDVIASMTDRQVLSLGRTLRLPKKSRSVPAMGLSGARNPIVAAAPS